MNFIDIFDFSKYFKRNGDGQRAKIGHVNAVIEKIPLEKVVNITSTQINALDVTSVELLPELSVNQYYSIESIIYEYKFNSQVFVVLGDLNIAYLNLVGSESGLTSIVLPQILGTYLDMVIGEDIVSYVKAGPRSLYLKSDGTISGGNGTLRVKIKYFINTIG